MMDSRYPMNATFELTARCNLQCQMCMFRRDDVRPDQELTAAQWIDLAKQACKAGTLQLLITGGEPLLRKDFPEIWQGIYPLGFLTTLFTNATLITPQLMALLRKMPPHKLGVTFYGSCNADYQEVCGCPDGFDRAMEGLTQLMTLPSQMEIRMTPVARTADSIEPLRQRLREQFGQELILTDRVLGAVRGACADPKSCRMSPGQTVQTLWTETERRLREIVPEQLRGAVQLKVTDQCLTGPETATLLGCNGGMKDYTISWDGKLLGCQLLDCFATHALNEGLQQAWDRFPTVVRLPREDSCQGCEHREICAVCPAVRMAETGSLSGVPEYICQITELSQKRKEAIAL